MTKFLVLFEQSVDELSEVNEIIELRVGRFPLPRGKKSASTDCSNTTKFLHLPQLQCKFNSHVAASTESTMEIHSVISIPNTSSSSPEQMRANPAVKRDCANRLCSDSPLMQISSLWAGGIGRHVTQ
jgi:hypothetical protein